MKKTTLLSAFLLVLTLASAQTTVKKYVLLEHFTNSRCGICASRNPAFYNLIDDYPADVRHVAVHPSVPYSNCVFYQANTADNSARANYYGINGTPRVAVNGTLIPAGNPLLPAATLQAALDDTSPLHVGVTETGSGANRTATITLSTLDALPVGNYRLFAIVAEKTVNQLTPNGEAVHHDVLRDILLNNAGEPVNLPPGSTTTITADYTIASGWNADEIYVLAFVQNIDTKEVLNSGTRFDPPLTTATTTATATALRLYPTPAHDVVYVDLGVLDNTVQVELFDLTGRRVAATFEVAGTVVTVQTGALKPGVYVVKVGNGTETRVGKFLKM